MSLLRIVLFLFFSVIGANHLFAQSDTLFGMKGNQEYFGETKELDTFSSHGFQLKYSRDLGRYKFRFLYNTTPESRFGFDRVVIGLVCIFNQERWKLFTGYYTEIDSVYTLDTDGLGNPEICLISSYDPDAFFPSSGCGWQGIDSTLELFNIDSNYITFSEIFSYYRRYWSNSENEEWDYELRCSSKLKFELSTLTVSNYFYEFEGNEDLIDKETQECPCPTNGKYFLKGYLYIKNEP